MAIAESTEHNPAVLITSATDLGKRTGGLLAALASGALVRVDDLRVGRSAALLVPPQLIPRVLEAVGIDPASLMEPGAVNDAV